MKRGCFGAGWVGGEKKQLVNEKASERANERCTALQLDFETGGQMGWVKKEK